MFYEVSAFLMLTEALKEIRETHLLTMFLSKWAVHDSTDSESYVIVRKTKIDK